MLRKTGRARLDAELQTVFQNDTARCEESIEAGRFSPERHVCARAKGHPGPHFAEYDLMEVVWTTLEELDAGVSCCVFYPNSRKPVKRKQNHDGKREAPRHHDLRTRQ